MGDVGALRRATAGQQLFGSDQAMFDRLAQFMRSEFERLHAEPIDREQSSLRARVFSTSRKANAIYTVAVIGVIAAASVGLAGGFSPVECPYRERGRSVLKQQEADNVASS